MTVRSKPILPIDASDELLSLDDSASSTAAFLAGAFAFLCFMPYPAIPIGSNSAVQLGNVATLLALICTSIELWAGVVPIVGVLLLLPIVSTMKVLLVDTGDASVCFKSTISLAVSLLTLLAVQVHVRRHAMAMLTGIAVAILLHVAVGILQIYSFSSNVFPLAELYVNPSFLSVQDYADTIARWIQRPFGLFPEPSAMSSSLAPFVLFFTAVLLDVVHLRTGPKRWQRLLFTAAAAGGLGLIIVSRSGHALPTGVAMLLLLMIWAVRARANIRSYLFIASLSCLVMPLIVRVGFDALGARVAQGSQLGNDSWDERSTSLLLGLKLWMEDGLSTLLFGLGPGRTSEAVERVSGISAVFSVLLSYVYDTGMLGLLAVSLIARRLILTCRASRWNVGFATIAIVWTIGISLTTSYGQLLPIWVAMGFLVCWNDICEIPKPAARVAPVREEMPRTRRPADWVSPWTAPMPTSSAKERPST